MTALLAGFGLGFSLILAIGAQNAFVLRQGLRGAHVNAVVAVCILSDAALIAAGVAGFGVLVERVPAVEPVMRWLGAAFLVVYGAMALRRALGADETLAPAAAGGGGRRRAVLAALALTWLNPHVYLDTVVLVGAVAAQYGDERWVFGTGAIMASFVFFAGLGHGARVLRPVFARPIAWRFLEAGVACLMWSIAIALILS